MKEAGPKHKTQKDRKQHSIILTATPMKSVLEDAKEKKDLKEKNKVLKRKITDTENNQNKGKHTKMSKQNEKKIMEKGKKLISHNKKREQLRKLAEENSISIKHRQKIWTRKPYVMTMKITTPTIDLLLIQSMFSLREQ